MKKSGKRRPGDKYWPGQRARKELSSCNVRQRRRKEFLDYFITAKGNLLRTQEIVADFAHIFLSFYVILFVKSSIKTHFQIAFGILVVVKYGNY